MLSADGDSQCAFKPFNWFNCTILTFKSGFVADLSSDTIEEIMKARRVSNLFLLIGDPIPKRRTSALMVTSIECQSYIVGYLKWSPNVSGLKIVRMILIFVAFLSLAVTSLGDTCKFLLATKLITLEANVTVKSSTEETTISPTTISTSKGQIPLIFHHRGSFQV